MIRYTVRYRDPHRHFISFEASFPAGPGKLMLQLPAWRPGRYELGNFSKNIRAWHAYDNNRNELVFRKITKDLWEVDCAGSDAVIITYEYYANELNAGSTFIDGEQLYINPVNCFFYLPGQTDLPYEINFDLPDTYQVACGLKKTSAHVLQAGNFDELADCPMIASASLKHLSYVCDRIVYNIWIQDEVKLDEPRLLKEFKAFTNAQLEIFGDIPCDQYHFLFHFTPYFIRHGVEHRNSTVIAMGPSSEFQNDSLFKDLLGISCHELFHTWNVKNIRPAEMMPYDFSKENYTRLGYVAEGVTTYYGDILLWRAGCINDDEWFVVLNEAIQKHIDNPGRFNLSVADSGYDSWLDGYSAGIPWRKVSIYTEGSLIAMMCDIELMLHSGGKKSLDDVMKKLYDDFGKKQTGYSEDDYSRLVKDGHSESLEYIFRNFVYGTTDYVPFLQHVLDAVGILITEAPSPKWCEAYLGLYLEEGNQKVLVQSVIPGSPADKAGLWNGDEIFAVNNISLYKNFQSLVKMFNGEVELSVNTKNRAKQIAIAQDGKVYGMRYKVALNPSASAEQMKLFQRWKTRQPGN